MLRTSRLIGRIQSLRELEQQWRLLGEDQSAILFRPLPLLAHGLEWKPFGLGYPSIVLVSLPVPCNCDLEQLRGIAIQHFVPYELPQDFSFHFLAHC